MDFNELYAIISPYLGTTGIATLIIGLFTIAVKVSGLIKAAKKAFSSTHNEAVEAFKKAIPPEIYIKLETIAKTELAKIKTEFTEAVEEKFITQIKANTELCRMIGYALLSMKAIPDSVKEQMSAMLDIEQPDTTESLKVELLPNGPEEVKEEKKNSSEVYID